MLFIDFLGFKEIVDRTANDRPYLAQLVAAMDRVGEIGHDDKEFSKSQRVTPGSGAAGTDREDRADARRDRGDAAWRVGTLINWVKRQTAGNPPNKNTPGGVRAGVLVFWLRGLATTDTDICLR
ncbi:hypothetical protein M2281_005665 [Mesorhizobium soli]|uniref:hypothetical protein n=1 Tax=Pseudaminobacter soli (ex Li et al. 2025) TaxID=1295366 RepID=UPI002474F7B6|nr:hypothetical protein [Mesorhizobium soli]MDH6235043.1 hypothetical protein [Mesorhizobium soli]